MTTPAPETDAPRLPAEWEPHAATWLAWPKNPRDWPGKFHPIPWVFGEIVRRIAQFETVRLLVDDAAWEDKARRVLGKAGADLERVRFHHVPTDRGWCRDMLPAFTLRRASPRVRAVRFGFTGWAKYPDHLLDAEAPEHVARALKMPMVRAAAQGRPLVLEGGGIDGNGRGTLLTTEECFLDPITQVRNPGLTARDYEDAFREFLGVEQVIWLGKGIAGDDTHGHVDDLCRFVAPDAVVLCREKDPSDENYRVLEENRERLEGVRLHGGGKLQVIDLPMPEPLFFDGVRLPASYANFYIANGTVLVPTFNDPRDRIALGILAECFPDRIVTGVHAVDLVWGFGTLHCLTHEQPSAGKALDIVHTS
ncbi:Agmatine deiminase [Fundidesulfovibrio magnetotacticus]|uniref:Agmatine deiminase n=1 Tax=Fundidesulfovibrio magnetotacticus TaxID=2730080 RepID=A0A6V8LQK4_9BACT|nr:agmatine deiminase family protein [Fundidesulfovibrio magnetotacticus]GFK94014.1 Agmatine deiminase [Fundidesulfovibrio magnetotacticus]